MPNEIYFAVSELPVIVKKMDISKRCFWHITYAILSTTRGLKAANAVFYGISGISASRAVVAPCYISLLFTLFSAETLVFSSIDIKAANIPAVMIKLIAKKTIPNPDMSINELELKNCQTMNPIEIAKNR
mgnify:CR=1 FL=1